MLLNNSQFYHGSIGANDFCLEAKITSLQHLCITWYTNIFLISLVAICMQKVFKILKQLQIIPLYPSRPFVFVRSSGSLHSRQQRACVQHAESTN